MAYDPNLNVNRPDLQTPPPREPRNSWAPLAVIAAAAVAGVVIWSMMSGPATDPAATSSTTATPPAATDTAPAITPMEPATPAAPSTNGTAPAAPATSNP